MKWRFDGKGFSSFALACAFAVILPACSGEGGKKEPAAGESAAKQAERVNLSDVELRTLDGRSAKISDYKGKILFVTFWATWHADSRALIPMLHEIQRKYNKNVQVMAIAMDEQGASAVNSWLAGRQVNFANFVEGERTANSFGGARDLPTTYILLRDGSVYLRLDGFKRPKQYNDIILSMYRQHL